LAKARGVISLANSYGTPKWRQWKWQLGGVVAIVLCVTVIGPFLFLHVIEGPAPKPLSLPTAHPTVSSSLSPSDSLSSGAYLVAANSEAEYRVQEILFGQSATAVGKTSSVTGSVTLQGTTVTAAHFTVPLATVHSNESLRDDQFRGRIMDVARYPDAVFALSKPIHLGAVPVVDQVFKVDATGTLAMHGVTRTVTFSIQAKYTGTEVEVSGSIPITFSNWDIQNPSGGPAQVGNSGTMEFLLYLSHS
jgi:polyisoprenoid-binding protein YceI